MTVSSRRQRERLRECFRTPCIQFLFIGESPPASGRFFYSANSGLYRAMRMAFQIADSTVNHDNFLAVFQERGCYLTDLWPEPIDQLDPDERRALRRHGEKRLARQLKRFRPVMIGPCSGPSYGMSRTPLRWRTGTARFYSFPIPEDGRSIARRLSKLSYQLSSA